ncbi:tyrosine-type recombinase/integrase [Haloarcula sp. H-GB5]
MRSVSRSSSSREATITTDEAAALEWSPKNPNASREVPFDEWPESQTTINRRVDTALERVDEFDRDTTTPHGLRATAASHASARGLSPLPLQSMFGWADISTARNYVASSSENTQRQLHQIYSR